MRPERFPLGILKNRHARYMSPHRVVKKFGFNTYALETPEDLSINPVFNVEELTPYHTPFDTSNIMFVFVRSPI